MTSAGKFNRQGRQGAGYGGDLLKVKEVAARLRISNDAVYRLIHQQELEAVKVSGPRSFRVREGALEAYLSRRSAQ